MSSSQIPVALIVQPIPGIRGDLWKNKWFILATLGCIFGWIFGSALAYSLSEGIHYYSSIYFTIINITTTGFGDIHPETDIGRLIAILNSFFGILVFGIFVAVITLALQGNGTQSNAPPKATQPTPSQSGHGIQQTLGGVASIINGIQTAFLAEQSDRVKILELGRNERIHGIDLTLRIVPLADETGSRIRSVRIRVDEGGDA